MRIHGGYFVFYSLWVCFGCFVWFGLVFSSRFFRSKWSISAMCIFLGSIVISHRLSRSIFRSPSLSISLAARSATKRQKRVFRPKQRDLLFVSFFWDKLWHIVSLDLQKTAQKRSNKSEPQQICTNVHFSFAEWREIEQKKMRLTTYKHTEKERPRANVSQFRSSLQMWHKLWKVFRRSKWSKNTHEKSKNERMNKWMNEKHSQQLCWD